MMQSIKEKIKSGLPIIAECGGFMYLHDTLAIDDKHTYPMVGVIPGKAFPTAKLQRFGYVRLYAKENNLLCNINEELLAHEFHYWDSENCGSGFKAVKESSGTCEREYVRRIPPFIFLCKLIRGFKICRSLP